MKDNHVTYDDTADKETSIGTQSKKDECYQLKQIFYYRSHFNAKLFRTTSFDEMTLIEYVLLLGKHAQTIIYRVLFVLTLLYRYLVDIL